MKKFLLSVVLLLASCSVVVSKTEIYMKAAKAVGSVSCGEVTGTYFVVKYRGTFFAITAKHVIGSDEKIQLDSIETRKSEWEYSTDRDLAAYKITGIVPTHYFLLEHTLPLEFDEIFSIGNPFGIRKIFFFGCITRNDLYNGGWISLPAAPGSSGGPVISASSGKVYGMTIQIPMINFSYFPILQRIESSLKIEEFLETLL